MKVGTDGVLLGAWTTVANANRILDVGTGSGLIAVMLAQRTTDSVLIEAVEVMERAAQRAACNVKASPWAARVNVHHTKIQDFESAWPYDLIVSNPPFFINSLHSPHQHRNIARHNNQLTQIDLLAALRRLLSPEGVFSVILPVEEGDRFLALANSLGFFCIRRCAVFTQRGSAQQRWLLEFTRFFDECLTQELILFDGNIKTQDYARLTANFYLEGSPNLHG
jgi:tRNA1Val (adenine37-N6)-methyltransferase